MERLSVIGGIVLIAVIAAILGVLSDQLFGRFSSTVFNGARAIAAVLFIGLMAYMVKLRFS